MEHPITSVNEVIGKHKTLLENIERGCANMDLDVMTMA